MLRDEGRAADRLAHCLARSRYAADLLVRSPESVADPRRRQRPDPARRGGAHGDDAVGGRAPRAASAGRRRRCARSAATSCSRIVIADLVGADRPRGGRRRPDRPHRGDDPGRPRGGRSGGGGARGRAARRRRARRRDGQPRWPRDGLRLRRRRMFVHRAARRASDEEVAAPRTSSSRSCAGCSPAGPDPRLGLDTDLRPEGKAGPLVRSLDAYRTYYERWARPGSSRRCCGPARSPAREPLADAFRELIDPLRWPRGRHRRPPGARHPHHQGPGGGRAATRAEPTRAPTSSSGCGGLTDVEWVVQLLQLEHAHAQARRCASPAPWRGSTPWVARACSRPRTSRALREAWRLGALMRNAGRALARAADRQRPVRPARRSTASAGSWAGPGGAQPLGGAVAPRAPAAPGTPLI